jgi:hypothetical protein
MGADEFCGKSWQLITAIHDEGDDLTLCGCFSQGYDGTNCPVTLKLLL